MPVRRKIIELVSGWISPFASRAMVGVIDAPGQLCGISGLQRCRRTRTFISWIAAGRRRAAARRARNAGLDQRSSGQSVRADMVIGLVAPDALSTPPKRGIVGMPHVARAAPVRQGHRSNRIEAAHRLVG